MVVVRMDTLVEITYICKLVYAINPCSSLLGRALGRVGKSHVCHMRQVSSLWQNKHDHGRPCDRTDFQTKKVLAVRITNDYNISYPIAGGSQGTTDNRSPAANDSSTRFHRPVVLRSTAQSSPMDVASRPQSLVLFVATFLSLFLLPLAEMTYDLYVLDGSTDVHLFLIV